MQDKTLKRNLSQAGDPFTSFLTTTHSATCFYLMLLSNVDEYYPTKDSINTSASPNPCIKPAA